MKLVTEQKPALDKVHSASNLLSNSGSIAGVGVEREKVSALE